MPFEVQPIAAAPAAGTYSPPSESVHWLDQQPFSVDQAWKNIGEYRAGGSLGGPTAAVRSIVSDPHQFAIAAPAPPILAPAATKAKAFGKFGTVTIDEIDPFMSINSGLQGIGVSQQDAAQATTGVQGFFDKKGIDLANAPSRLFDYATGWLAAGYDTGTGKPVPVVAPKPGSQVTYKFQSDPAYWSLVGAPDLSPAQIHDIASTVAQKYVAGGDSYLTEQLAAQFTRDRQRALGLSSGDERQDYLAKLAFTEDYITQQAGGKVLRAVRPSRVGPAGLNQYIEVNRPESAAASLAIWPAAVASALPFAGTDLAEAAYKHPQRIEDAWAGLTPQQRQGYFGKVGIPSLAGDAAVFLPMLGGLGAVEAVATRTGGLAAKGFQVYNNLLRVTNAVMATGLVVATGNWALEAAVPGYSEAFGKRLDYARPFSSSSLAGIVNNLGYFSSGTFGANLAARSVARGATKALELAHVPLPGAVELNFFKFGFGGSAIRNEVAATGLPNPGVLDNAPRQTFLSHLTNYREAEQRAGLEAAIRGEPTGDPAFDALPAEAKIEYANAALLRGVEQRGAVVESDVKLLAEARRDRPLANPEAQAIHDRAAAHAQYLDDELAKTYVNTYGQGWLTRLTGSYTAKDMEAYARAAVTRLGGDGAKLASHNEEGWAQAIRTIHAYEYTSQNALLHEVAQGAEEAPRIMLMQADHLFANDVGRDLAVLRGEDQALAGKLSASIVRTKREAADWYANRWKPDAGVARTPENVPPAELAKWLEDVQRALPSRRILPSASKATAGEPLNAFHAQLERDGLWTLGFKPIDEAGNAISYLRRSDGSVFKSPWVEYPLGSEANIAMGNRGLLLSKLDGAFRGFRTWRIAEFQKGLLYRRLSGRLDVSAEQIDRYYAGVLKLARKHGVQPQTLGAAGKAALPLPGAAAWGEELRSLAGEVFGSGELRLKAGGTAKIDWPDEVARSFQQSLRLNATAGLTSYLKANLGEPGAQIAWLSDVGYVAFRFNLSPVFKGGELVESAQLNLMRGVRGVDDQAIALYAHIGVGNDYSALNAERAWDPMLASLTAKGEAPSSISSRNAASMAFKARSLPETFGLKTQTAVTQGEAAKAAFARFTPDARGNALPPEVFWSDPDVYVYRVVDEARVAADWRPGEYASMNPQGTYVQDLNRSVILRTGKTGFEPAKSGVNANLNVQATKAIPASKVEVLHADGTWGPATGMSSVVEPLANDEAGLIAQLHATLAGAPKAGSLTELDRLVGGNGIVPGLETRARQILTKLEDIQAAKVDAGPTFEWATRTPEVQQAFRQRLEADGWNPGGQDVVQRTRLDGTIEERRIADLYDQSQRQQGAASSLEDVAGTPEAFFTEVGNMANEASKVGGPGASAWQRFRSDLAHPARFKTQKMTALEIDLMRRQFPALLKLSGNDGVAAVYRSLGIPEARWLDHLIEDRHLLTNFMNSNSQADLEKLIAHAGGDAGAVTFARLYESEDWAVLSSLISTNLRVASQEAFGTHFFSAYRSAFERTINHPLLGIYPASWTIKISREWAKFLFDNQALGVRLGMAPAQAIARIVQGQKAALALGGGDPSTDYLSTQGPLGSAALIFNLLLPGDWSGLPFPASRTIRDISRPILATNTLPDMGAEVGNNLNNMGLGRDLRLFAETIGQVGDLLNPADPLGKKLRAKKPYSVTGVSPSLNLDTTR